MRARIRHRKGAKRKFSTSPKEKPSQSRAAVPRLLKVMVKPDGSNHDYDERGISLPEGLPGAGGKKPDYHPDNQGCYDDVDVGVLLPDEPGVSCYCLRALRQPMCDHIWHLVAGTS